MDRAASFYLDGRWFEPTQQDRTEKDMDEYGRLSRTLALDEAFGRHIRASGATPPVHILHGGAKRSSGWHQSGTKARGKLIDGRLEVESAMPADEAATNYATFVRWKCEGCGALVTYSLETMLKAVAGALLGDTRQGKRYVARLR